MGLNKLERFAETATFPNFVQPDFYYKPEDHEYKGHWAETFFKNSNPIVLELGCGKGEYTVGLAEMYPEKNFIGCDIKGARMWRGARTALDKNLSNVGFLRIQIDQITQYFDANEISEIWITFPDPQPQKPRTRKRLTSTNFLEKYRRILKTDAIIHLKTDNVPFFDFTLEVIEEQKHRLNFSTHDLYGLGIENEVSRIQTFYESMFLSEGMKICYLNFCLS